MFYKLIGIDDLRSRLNQVLVRIDAIEQQISTMEFQTNERFIKMTNDQNALDAKLAEEGADIAALTGKYNTLNADATTLAQNVAALIAKLPAPVAADFTAEIETINQQIQALTDAETAADSTDSQLQSSNASADAALNPASTDTPASDAPSSDAPATNTSAAS